MKWLNKLYNCTKHKLILIICIITILTVYFEGAVNAKIRSQTDFNDSIAFYVDDRWIKNLERDAATFVKYISASGNEKYWIRVDAFSNHKSQQYADLIINETTMRISQIEEPRMEYLRCGYHKEVNRGDE